MKSMSQIGLKKNMEDYKMTIEQNKLFVEGRGYYSYILKKYPYDLRHPLKPGRKAIYETAKELDLTFAYVEKCLDVFLNN